MDAAVRLAGVADLGMTPALEAVSRGDLAWWEGDRRAAVAAWHAALARRGPGPEDVAAEIMARLRLQRREGNLAPMVHERAIDRARAACPADEPWCRVAEADWLLWMPRFAGGDPARVEAELDGVRLGAAAARRVVAGAPIDTLGDVDRDGMGEGIWRTGRRTPPDPGTWTIALGLGGAPGLGFGASVRFVDPDLAFAAHRLEVTAGGDSRGGIVAAAALRLSLPVAPEVAVSGARVVGDVWTGDDVVTVDYLAGYARVGVAPRLDVATLRVGAYGRVDDGLANAGPYAAVGVGGGAVGAFALGGEVGAGDYTFASLSVDGRAYPALGNGTLALRGYGVAVLTEDAPWFREPSAGGLTLLRGQAAGRWRDRWLTAAQAEYRHGIWGPLEGAAFVDVVAVDGMHATAGLGLRLVLPPEHDNVTRLDVGFGDGTWGVVVGWGEAF